MKASDQNLIQEKVADNRQWMLKKVATDAPVECGTCRACCRSTAVILYPELGDDPLKYHTVPVVDPYWAGPRRMLARRPDGACCYLDDERGCTIHERRPRACRAYSCVEQWRLLSRTDRRRLQREGKWTEVLEAGERRNNLLKEGYRSRQAEADPT